MLHKPTRFEEKFVVVVVVLTRRNLTNMNEDISMGNNPMNYFSFNFSIPIPLCNIGISWKITYILSEKSEFFVRCAALFKF